MKMAGKVALVTGAGKGIGKAIAMELSKAGLFIGVLALHAESAQAAAEEIEALGPGACALTADISDQNMVNEALAKLTKKFGPTDILVNNAAAPAQMLPFDKTDSQIQHDELITFTGALNCTRAVLPAMMQRRAGRIINISSISGRYGMPGRAIYSAANAAIDGFTRAMAHELGHFGITVNSISPGATESPRFKARSKEIRDAHSRMIALPRFGEPQDIAHAVLFLASQEASYITGAILDVDGGFSGYEPYHTT